MATARVVPKECRPSADAGTTSTPPGQRSRIARSRSLGLELIARDELADVVDPAVRVEPVRVRAVMDLRLLRVRELLCGILLDDLVELHLPGRRELAAHRSGSEGEELRLLRHAV